MPAFPTQSLLFEFSRLPSADSAIASAHGSALIGYDGKGLWWIDTIRIYGRRPGDPCTRVSREDPDFNAIAVALDVSRSEEIAAEINKKLRFGGGHMALFGEHMPNDTGQRRAPPYASPSTRPRLVAA